MLVAMALSVSIFVAIPSSVAFARPLIALPQASVVVDGVNVTVQSPVLPTSKFSAPMPDQGNQMAIMTSIHPYRELDVLAVPFGASSPFEAFPSARAGSAIIYRSELHSLRVRQNARPLTGPLATIFSQQVASDANIVNLAYNGISYAPAVVVEWVTEAGNREWMVRVVVETSVANATIGGAQGFVNALSQIRLSSSTLNAPSSSLNALSAAPVTREGVTGSTGSKMTSVVQGASTNLAFPSWWNGNCDANAHGSPQSYPLGDSYLGVAACGPRPAFDNCGSYCDYPEHFFSGAWGELEWECVELSMRYLYSAYGVAPYSANGNQVVANYSGTTLNKVSNGSGIVPVPGDVISFNASSAAGHTAVVASSNVSGGAGTIYILQQNYGGNGYGNSNDLIPETVSGYTLQDVYGMHPTGWLHSGWGGVGNATFLGTDTLITGQTMHANTYLASANALYALMMQSDGNLVLYHGSSALWASNTGGHAGASLTVQGDGNIVIYSSSGSALWSTHTMGQATNVFVVQSDGNVVAYDTSNKAVWASGTGGNPAYTWFGSDLLTNGQSLTSGTYIQSTDLRYAALMQTDGNFVMYGPGYHILWSSQTAGNPGAYLVLQSDGNIVIYSSTAALWSTHTNGQILNDLVMQTDGNLVAYSSTNSAIWSSKTSGQI